MITNEQVEAALKAWYDAGDAGNFASMFAALKAAELTSCARIAELEAALKPFADYSLAVDWEVFTPEMHFARSLKFPCGILYADLRAARAALGEKE